MLITIIINIATLYDFIIEAANTAIASKKRIKNVLEFDNMPAMDKTPMQIPSLMVNILLFNANVASITIAMAHVIEK